MITSLILITSLLEIWRNMECISITVVCEQALWGALVAGQEKEGELANYVSGI